jgi:hypothetical protein
MSIHDAVRHTYTHFQTQTNITTLEFIEQRLGIPQPTAYQWQQAVDDDARRRISVVNAIRVSNCLNAELRRRGLPCDYSISNAVCAATGLICIEPPHGVDIERTSIPAALDAFNTLVQEYMSAHADGEIGLLAELPAIERAGFHLQACVQALVEECRAKAVNDTTQRTNGRAKPASRATVRARG